MLPSASFFEFESVSQACLEPENRLKPIRMPVNVSSESLQEGRRNAGRCNANQSMIIIQVIMPENDH